MKFYYTEKQILFERRIEKTVEMALARVTAEVWQSEIFSRAARPSFRRVTGVLRLCYRGLAERISQRIGIPRSLLAHRDHERRENLLRRATVYGCEFNGLTHGSKTRVVRAERVRPRRGSK